MSIPDDVRLFLAGYPGSPNNSSLNDNLRFYQNTQQCQPDNLLIEELLEQWDTAYDKLERNHGFIQWLFPIKEYGMNYQSQPLQQHELESMSSNPDIIGRLTRSYKLMLNFYGMRLVDEQSGEIDRSELPKDYEPRYQNLLRHPHNNLRISRILKCLSLFGLERFNGPFLLHVLNEQNNGELFSRGLVSSMDRWWANCIRDDEDRKWIGETIAKVRKGELEFTREMYEKAVRAKHDKGRFNLD